jgi:coenzyme F420-reducing hydrogenase beta subunit
MLPNKECTACTGCANIYPKNAISFAIDKEGFRFSVISESLCIECNLCAKTCPLLTEKDIEANHALQCYAVVSKIHGKNGSSGEAFSAIADFVLEKGGVVVVVAFNEYLQLRHLSS